MSRDAPIQPQFAGVMNALAEGIDEGLNGRRRPKTIGFALLVFEFGKTEGGRVNYVSNAERSEMITAVKEWLARAEGRVIETEKVAEIWNARWDAWRAGEDLQRLVAPGSLSDAFARYRATGTWSGKAAKTRIEWERAWRDIEPVFGDVAPSSVAYDHIDLWYSALLEETTLDRAWRAMKIWRALWEIASGMRHNGVPFTGGHEDPSAKVRRRSQPKRALFWRAGEAVRLVKQAWRDGSKGLACIMAVAWDSQLSPGDVRTLSIDQLGDLGFWTARGKTKRAALGTISPRTARLIAAYLDGLPQRPAAGIPMFQSQSGAAFTDQALAKSFWRNRAKVFPGDTRTLMDMRRSGAVEANAGNVDAGALGAKMANSIASARDLQLTYQPVDAATVARADEARRRGRSALRGTSKNHAKPVSTQPVARSSVPSKSVATED